MDATQLAVTMAGVVAIAAVFVFFFGPGRGPGQKGSG
jgi:hypothetical protein